MADDPARDAQTRMWSIGDYPAIARHLLPISEATVAALDIQADRRVLDVAVGNGNRRHPGRPAGRFRHRDRPHAGPDRPSPGPLRVGRPGVAQARLAAAGLDATVETCDFAWRFPSAEVGFETFVTAAGPFVMFMATMQRQSLADTARTALLEAMAETNVATDGTCELPAAYLLMTATR